MVQAGWEPPANPSHSPWSPIIRSQINSEDEKTPKIINNYQEKRWPDNDECQHGFLPPASLYFDQTMSTEQARAASRTCLLGLTAFLQGCKSSPAQS